MISYRFVPDGTQTALVRFACFGATLACSHCRAVDVELGVWGGSYVCGPCFKSWNTWIVGSDYDQYLQLRAA